MTGKDFGPIATELINLRERRAPLADTKRHTSTFCRQFSPKSTSGHLFHSVFSGDTLFSGLRSQAQNTFNEAPTKEKLRKERKDK